MPDTRSIAQQLGSIVGGENLHQAGREDSVCGVQPKFVAEPRNEQQLAATLAYANGAGLAVIPRGGGSKLDWGNPPKRADMVVSTRHLSRIIEHAWADLTVSVEAGCTLETLAETLAQHGQRLAFDGLWPERATVGGVLATNDSGSLRLRFGPLRDLIIGVTLALPDGTLATSGGKVVKNVAGYDLPKLATGALGTLGVVTRAIFRVHPLPHDATTLTCAIDRVSEAQRPLAQVLDSKLAYSALQVRLPDSERAEAFIDILFEGTQQGIAAQIVQLETLAAPFRFRESPPSPWGARRELHAQLGGKQTYSALLKISALPADAIPALTDLTTMGVSLVHAHAVVQATGLGTILLSGDEQHVRHIATVFRERMQRAGGSLVALGSSRLTRDFDAWGDPGDALPLMRAIKHQLDPCQTLNPARFVGGI